MLVNPYNIYFIVIIYKTNISYIVVRSGTGVVRSEAPIDKWIDK